MNGDISEAMGNKDVANHIQATIFSKFQAIMFSCIAYYPCSSFNLFSNFPINHYLSRIFGRMVF